jgi:hypothetical protein
MRLMAAASLHWPFAAHPSRTDTPTRQCTTSWKTGMMMIPMTTRSQQSRRRMRAPQEAQHHLEAPPIVSRLPLPLINCRPIKLLLCPRWQQRLHKWLHCPSYHPRPRTRVPMRRTISSMSRPFNKLLSRCSSHFQPQGLTLQDGEVSVEVAVAIKVDAEAVAAACHFWMQCKAQEPPR